MQIQKAILILGCLLASAASAQQMVCDIQTLQAATERHYMAEDADQGAAANSEYFFAVDNSVIAKHRRSSGELVQRWSGESHGLLQHMNSCFHEEEKLYCANSNYSTTPMASSLEVFDAQTLTHLSSHSFGLTEAGSLTWVDRVENGWIAAFTHYGNGKGLDYKDSFYTNVVAFDASWRRTGGWMFPLSVLELMAPYGASGGAIGPDGFLYVTGHDRQEMYVLAKPVMGPYLIHIATIAIEPEGQAFSWIDGGDRQVIAVNRSDDHNRVLQLAIPAVEPECMQGLITGFVTGRE